MPCPVPSAVSDASPGRNEGDRKEPSPSTPSAPFNNRERFHIAVKMAPKRQLSPCSRHDFAQVKPSVFHLRLVPVQGSRRRCAGNVHPVFVIPAAVARTEKLTFETGVPLPLHGAIQVLADRREGEDLAGGAPPNPGGPFKSLFGIVPAVLPFDEKPDKLIGFIKSVDGADIDKGRSPPPPASGRDRRKNGPSDTR